MTATKKLVQIHEASFPPSTAEWVEQACAAWWDSHIESGQFNWDGLASGDDHRIPGWRAQMRAALERVGFFDLVWHHREHHQVEST